MIKKEIKNKGLGRKLADILGDVNVNDNHEEPQTVTLGMQMIPIEYLFANPKQPRRYFSPEALDELASSIKEKGILQPIIVRPQGENRFEIVAGERRWRAAQQATCHEIPVIIRDLTDAEVLEIAIIENIQRADLNPVEEAEGYQQLIDRFGHTQLELATSLGKSRSYVANVTRLLNLPDDVLTFLRQGKITAGHARALITSDDPSHIAQHVIRHSLSVRATEKLVESRREKGGDNEISIAQMTKSADTQEIEKNLKASLGMKVQIHHKSGQESGKITIAYTKLDDFDKLCRRLIQN